MLINVAPKSNPLYSHNQPVQVTVDAIEVFFTLAIVL